MLKDLGVQTVVWNYNILRVIPNMHVIQTIRANYLLAFPISSTKSSTFGFTWIKVD